MKLEYSKKFIDFFHQTISPPLFSNKKNISLFFKSYSPCHTKFLMFKFFGGSYLLDWLILWTFEFCVVQCYFEIKVWYFFLQFGYVQSKFSFSTQGKVIKVRPFVMFTEQRNICFDESFAKYGIHKNYSQGGSCCCGLVVRDNYKGQKYITPPTISFVWILFGLLHREPK